MGVQTSRNARPKKQAPSSPRFASLYNSYLGYIGFGWQLLFGILALSMQTGFFENSSTATLLGLECITVVVYLALFWTNSAWYSVTFASRRYLKIDAKEVLPIMTDTPTFDLVTERDAKFHNDQKHFSVVLVAHVPLLIFLIAFLATQGTANPSPDFNVLPMGYDALALKQYNVIRSFQLYIVGIAAMCGAIMLDTHACLFHTSMVAINDDLMSGKFNADGKGLRPTSEYNNQPGQMTTNPSAGDTNINMNSVYVKSYLG